jgi:uncharacterized protein
MIITVFGATGNVGKEIVKLGILLGHTIKAYGRNIHELIELAEQHPNLELIKGGMFDKSDVAAAIKGSEAVISALGGAIDGSDNTRSLGMRYIVEGMEKYKVNRIVAIGGLGVLQADDATMLYEQENFPEAYIAVTLEHVKALQYLQATNFNWTFVCPPMIIEAAADGIYELSKNYPSKIDGSISTGNLAQFMLNETLQNNYIQTKVGITN